MNKTNKNIKIEPYYIGIDPSTTSLGVCVLDNNGKIVFTSHSKRPGKSKDWESKNNHAIDLFNDSLDDYVPSHVFMESAVYSTHSSTSVLFELCGVLKYIYFNHEKHNKINTFHVIMPRVWQSMIIEKSNPSKDDTLLAMERHFDYDFKSHDESDAAAIALFCFKYHTEPGFKSKATNTKDKKTKKRKEISDVVIELSY